MSSSSSTMSVAAGGARALSHLPAPAQDPQIRGAIAAILARVKELQSGIINVRAADAGKAVSYAAWLENNNDLRGRATMYPFIGAGIGNGALVELADGSVKWDLINGIGIHMFGHSDARMIEAQLESALSDTCMQGNIQHNADVLAIAQILIGQASRTSKLRHCFVTNSGCMANENALKICQQKTHAAPRVIAFADCFMGRSTTMSQIGDTPAYRQGLHLNTLVDYMPFFDALAPEESIAKATAHLKHLIERYPRQHSCFVMELIQGEGGLRIAPREFLAPLMQICRDAGIPVWADEIQTFGRTTSMFRYEALDVGDLIDVVTIGKMSQVCATLFTAEMNPGPGLLAGTFSASTSAFHVGRKALETLRDGSYYGPSGRIAELHQAFRECAEDLIARRSEFFPEIVDGHGRRSRSFIGGVGGMMRLTPLGGSKERIGALLKVLFHEGVIALNCGHGPYHLRFLAAIGVMKPEQFREVFQIVERSLELTVAAEK